MNIPNANVIKKKVALKAPVLGKNESDRLETEKAVKKVLAEFEGYTRNPKEGDRAFHTNVPFDGYRDDFKPLTAGLEKILVPLGYKIHIGDDGVGIHNTVVISW